MNQWLEIKYDNYMMTAWQEVARSYGKGRERMAVEIEDTHGCPLEKSRRWRERDKPRI